jgi:hypothetical protein
MPFKSEWSLDAAASNNLNALANFSQLHISAWSVDDGGNGAASKNDFSR